MCKNCDCSKVLRFDNGKKVAPKSNENEVREEGTNVIIEGDDSVANKKEWQEDLEL